MTDFTDRLALPLLATGQAQKELTHNEAITLLSFVAQASVVAVAPASVPIAPDAGQCWIVGGSPAGAWAGKPAHLACWTESGWRFVAPFEGLTAWSVADGKQAVFRGGTWSVGAVNVSTLSVDGLQVVAARQAAIASPSGGTTIDIEARATLGAILAAMRSHGLIAA